MTLSEAIEREKALAYSFGERWKRLGEPVGDLPQLEQEHKQMAEWLKELKAYREAEKEIEQELKNWQDIDEGKCRGLFLATAIIYHAKYEEVNADECCGKCKYHKPDRPYGGDINEWYCANEDSDNYTDYTDYEDSCEEFEER